MFLSNGLIMPRARRPYHSDWALVPVDNNGKRTIPPTTVPPGDHVIVASFSTGWKDSLRSLLNFAVKNQRLSPTT